MVSALGPFITEAEVIRKLGISRATVRRQVAANDFAPVYKLSPNRIAFKLGDVIAWAESRKGHA